MTHEKAQPKKKKVHNSLKDQYEKHKETVIYSIYKDIAAFERNTGLTITRITSNFSFEVLSIGVETNIEGDD